MNQDRRQGASGVSDASVIRIPLGQKAVGFVRNEGGVFEKWEDHWPSLFSQQMPKGSTRSLSEEVSIFTLTTTIALRKPGLYLHHVVVSTVLFEGGYLWDALNGWRNLRLTEASVDAMKQAWLFQQ